MRARLALLLAPLAATCSPSEPAPALEHLLFISLDTTRADQLGCYGNPRAHTPSIDGLARSGVRFTDVTAAAPTTLASHTSLMTGSWPHTHGVLRNGFLVHPENVMLAELLARAGFHTAAFLGSFALERRFDFDQGFEHYDEDFDLLLGVGGLDQNQRSAAAVTQALLEHLDDLERAGSDRRLFLFAHYFDAHAPYAPPEPFASRATGGRGRPSSDMKDVEAAVRARQRAMVGTEFGHTKSINEGFRGPLRAMVGRDTGEPTALDQRLADLYGGELSAIDRAIGDLLTGLGDRGLLEHTLIVLVADHGETFWEHHDLWNHGLWVYQTTVHVPLLMRFPDGRHRGVEVRAPVSTIDVLPTLCELLELELPERCEGVSLVPLMKGRPVEPHPVFCEANQPWDARAPGPWENAAKPTCVRRGPWKYVRSPYNRVEQLFHLDRDPGERLDLLASGRLGGEAAEALELLRADLRRWTADARPLPSHFNREQYEETRARLQDLGYVGEDGDGDRGGDGGDGGGDDGDR